MTLLPPFPEDPLDPLNPLNLRDCPQIGDFIERVVNSGLDGAPA